MDRADVVVVGGGQAGAGAALALREFGFQGRIVLVCAEAALPYERPPLSKECLLGSKQADEILIAPESAYAERTIELALDRPAQALDVERSCLLLADGRRLAYQSLVLATGARLRRLRVPGSDQAPVHYLRTLADGQALKTALAPGRRVVVVGGGFIGLEVATAARRLGCAVTVLESGPRLMARAVPPLVSDHFRGLHEQQGVRIRLGAGICGMDAQAGALRSLQLEGGEVLPADVLVAGVGIEPDCRLAAAAGITVDDGIVVDDQGRTSAPGVYACGDVARRSGARRLETWQHAVDSARAIAAAICGRSAAPPDAPWFWSDQAGVNFQAAGVCEGWTELVVRGDASSGRFSAFLLRDSRVVGVNTVNNGREMRTGRRWIAAGTRVDGDKLRDSGVRLEACAL